MAASTPQVFLECDDEIRGQKYICLSFLSPEKVLKNKDLFFFRKFLEFYALDYKVRASESFIMDQFRVIQSTLGDVVNTLENAHLSAQDVSGNVFKEMSAKITKVREEMSKKTASDLEEHVKKNMSDFRDSKIQDTFDAFMAINRQRLEDEFHKDNGFRTTIRGLKCRGVYSTHEQASARAQQLHKKDPYFNVYVGEMGQWLPWDPEPDDIPEQKYQNEQLDKLMQSYRENVSQKDAFFEEEKRQKMAEAASAAASAKAIYGEKGKEQNITTDANDMFTSDTPDLAIQRKQEAAENNSVIQHQ
jgi:hypothetical protein